MHIVLSSEGTPTDAHGVSISLIQHLLNLCDRFGLDKEKKHVMTIVLRGDGFNFWDTHNLIVFGYSILELAGNQIFPLVNIEGSETYNVTSTFFNP